MDSQSGVHFFAPGFEFPFVALLKNGVIARPAGPWQSPGRHQLVVQCFANGIVLAFPIAFGACQR